jgi:hypothetical protein
MKWGDGDEFVEEDSHRADKHTDRLTNKYIGVDKYPYRL